MRSKGLLYEELARKHLSRKGLKTITRNFTCRGGELDLVMQDGNTLVFVEVKYRKDGRFGSAAESITTDKKRKLIKAARIYIDKNKLWNWNCRFDVIAITGNSSLVEKPSIDWLKSAFQLNE